MVALFLYIKAHPIETVQWLLLAWGALNVAWAQWPMPKSAKAQAVWKVIHHVFQLIATSAGSAGTFTWPSLLRGILATFTSVPNPFEPAEPAVKPLEDKDVIIPAPGQPGVWMRPTERNKQDCAPIPNGGGSGVV